jgi:RimJ/RimL family protein N-acetyltransferase
MTPSFRLETKRLTLRPVTPADRADLIALEADPQVMRFLNGGQPVPEAGLPDADFLTPRGTEPEVLAALDRATGRFIGWFGFFDDGLIDGLRTAEIGYRLARAGWGQGFATEGAVALIAVALDTLEFDRVRASTMAVNIGSRRVMEKAGMRHVETLFPAFPHPIVGADQGEVIYEIRASRGNP